MRVQKYIKSICCTFLLLLTFLFSVNANAISFTNPYSHYSDGEQISSVLSDFAKSQGYLPVVSDKLTGVMSGKFDKVNPNTFMQGLNVAFNVRYYALGKTLYFFHESEMTQTMFKPASLQPNDLIYSLRQSNILSDSLPARVDKNGMIIVQGPATYVENFTNLAREFDQSQDKQVVMEVFKLKHAKADDYDVKSSDKTVIVPGVASILQRMVSGNANATSTSLSVTIKSPKMQSLLGQGLAALGKSQESTVSEVQSATTDNQTNGFSPSIIADSRLNAIIIHDYKFRMPFYKKVIEELDLPVKLVELHAAIIDIDVNETENLGIDWSGGKKRGNWAGQISSGNLNLSPSNPLPVNGNGGGIFSTIFSTNNSNFMMQVNMLEEENKAKTLGRPSILTFDNVEATLEDTTTNYVKVEGYQDTDLFEVVSGTILRVTPHIIEDDKGQPFIQMVISIQTNQDTNGNTSVGNEIPTVKQTRINTQAVVRQGQSLLLGGYYVENKTNGSNGITGLRNAPIVGGLFGSDSDSKFRRERLLMITPKIIELDENNVPQGLDEKSFIKSPGQDNYQSREPVLEEKSGCSSNRATTKKVA